jgi:hypothetical protein
MCWHLHKRVPRHYCKGMSGSFGTRRLAPKQNPSSCRTSVIWCSNGVETRILLMGDRVMYYLIQLFPIIDELGLFRIIRVYLTKKMLSSSIRSVIWSSLIHNPAPSALYCLSGLTRALYSICIIPFTLPIDVQVSLSTYASTYSSPSFCTNLIS